MIQIHFHVSYIPLKCRRISNTWGTISCNICSLATCIHIYDLWCFICFMFNCFFMYPPLSFHRVDPIEGCLVSTGRSANEAAAGCLATTRGTWGDPVMGEGSVPMGEFASAHRCRNKKFHYGICSSGNLAWFLADLKTATFSNFAEVCFFWVQVGETMIIIMDKFQRILFSKRATAKGLWCDDHGCGRLESIGYRSGAWLFW